MLLLFGGWSKTGTMLLCGRIRLCFMTIFSEAHFSTLGIWDCWGKWNVVCFLVVNQLLEVKYKTVWTWNSLGQTTIIFSNTSLIVHNIIKEGLFYFWDIRNALCTFHHARWNSFWLRPWASFSSWVAQSLVIH